MTPVTTHSNPSYVVTMEELNSLCRLKIPPSLNDFGFIAARLSSVALSPKRVTFQSPKVPTGEPETLYPGVKARRFTFHRSETG